MDAAKAVKLEIEVTAETANDLVELIAEKGVDFAEGLRLILGAGMGALDIQRREQANEPENQGYTTRLMNAL